MTAGNNSDRDLAERGKQSTKAKEERARQDDHGKEEKHPAVPPGLGKSKERDNPSADPS